MSAETTHFTAIISIKRVEVITQYSQAWVEEKRAEWGEDNPVKRERDVDDVLALTVRGKTLEEAINKAVRHLEAEYPQEVNDVRSR